MNEALQIARSGGLDAVDRLNLAGLTLDLRREELRDPAGTRIELRNRSFGVLRHLATNAGRVVTKDELLTANWPGVTVTEDSLTQCISEIRRALGDAGRDLIRTVPRRGYMIVLPDRSVAQSGTPIVTTRPPIAWRQYSIAIPVLLGAAILILVGSWTLTKDAGSRAPPLPGPTIVSRGPTVAVLPLANDTGDARQDTLADGMTQGMISALGRFGELRVLARGMTSAYRGRLPSAIDLGRSLGVDYAVDGNLRRDGDVSRVDIRLSDARTGAQSLEQDLRGEAGRSAGYRG
jgi:DNA-binding winged helix-turn-helix (wHTH) protein/TolB-like protein